MKAFNKYFDHTLLKPDATDIQILKLATEAVTYDLAAVCVNGCHVRSVRQFLNTFDSDVKVAAVVGFPLGAMSTCAKAAETHIAIGDGADEIDMVINIGAVKDRNMDYVKDEIASLAEICHGTLSLSGEPVVLKVIIETCLLTDDEIVDVTKIIMTAGADFVKTSTGFAEDGATVHGVSAIKAAIDDHAAATGIAPVRIKASGGIRTLEDARAMIESGADRLGCSSSINILSELDEEHQKA